MTTTTTLSRTSSRTVQPAASRSRRRIVSVAAAGAVLLGLATGTTYELLRGEPTSQPAQQVSRSGQPADRPGADAKAFVRGTGGTSGLMQDSAREGEDAKTYARAHSLSAR